MAIHNVIYGRGLFSTVNRRNQVVNRWNSAAQGNNFTATTWVPDHGPGIVTYSHLYVADQQQNDNGTVTVIEEPGMTNGQSYPAFHMAFEHADYAVVEQAAALVADEMQRQGWLWGWFGTGRVGTYL